jgi:hypothetical protein
VTQNRSSAQRQAIIMLTVLVGVFSMLALLLSYIGWVFDQDLPWYGVVGLLGMAGVALVWCTGFLWISLDLKLSELWGRDE